jgi:hypothetical protein
MKTRFIFSLAGLMALFTSCGIFSKNKSEEKFPARNPADEVTRVNNPEAVSFRLKSRANQLKIYAQEKGCCVNYCFLVDMSIHSGKNRFFVYDLVNNSIVLSGLVAHGCCNESFLAEAKFSNAPSCGCSSIGKYKVGAVYYGQYGKSYRLYGLEPTNSNAFKRAVVLHGFSCVPDKEIFPKPVCNSLGCAMVSKNFFIKLSAIIDQSKKPVLLWMYN